MVKNLSRCKFQFTLPRGERLGNTIATVLLPVSFNSRSRGGSDVPATAKDMENHAFQFTLPRGERRKPRPRRRSCKPFQFTLPRGERLQPTDDDVRAFSGFNSRSRGGSDQEEASKSTPAARFNSRSRGGSDRGLPPTHRHTKEFQFTLPRGERLGAGG